MDDSMSANQGLLRTTCQIVSYLAWRLIDPAAVAKLFAFRTSNLPPSIEGGREIAVVRIRWMLVSKSRSCPGVSPLAHPLWFRLRLGLSIVALTVYTRSSYQRQPEFKQRRSITFPASSAVPTCHLQGQSRPALALSESPSSFLSTIFSIPPSSPARAT